MCVCGELVHETLVILCYLVSFFFSPLFFCFVIICLVLLLFRQVFTVSENTISFFFGSGQEQECKPELFRQRKERGVSQCKTRF